MKIAITDCYASNTALVDALENAGHQTVHIITNTNPPPCFAEAALPQTSLGTVDASQSWSDTISTLATLGVERVLAGSEAGVYTADRLAADLDLPGNAVSTSSLRRNKADMQQALQDAGLRSVKSWSIGSRADLDAIKAELPPNIVVKPQDSFGNDGVQIREIDTDKTWDQFCRDVETSLGATTMLGDIQTSLLVQEHLAGREIVVNTVSRDGQHVVTDCWEYTKIDVNGMPDRVSAAVSLCPHELPDNLLKYALQTLDVVGVEHGPAHAEYFITDTGPVLMEVAARLSGADTASHAHESMGCSQIDALVDDVSGTLDWKQRTGTLPKLKQHVAMYYLTSSGTGVFQNFAKLDQVQNLASYWKFMPRISAGEQLSHTADEFAEPGMVSIKHPTQSVLWRDLFTLHYLDGDGFYETKQDQP